MIVKEQNDKQDSSERHKFKIQFENCELLRSVQQEKVTRYQIFM